MFKKSPTKKNLSLHFSDDCPQSFSDEKMFFLSSNPSIVPGFRIKLGNSESATNIFLRIVEHVKRNTAQRPCEENPGYSFTVCLQEAVQTLIGCSLPWTTGRKLGICTSLEQFDAFEKIYHSMNDENPRNLGSKFGCKIPCKYREYILDEKTEYRFNDNKGEQTVWITLSTPEVVIKQEKQIYEATSLVGDIGGSLGLFLGFSLLMVWDWLQNAVEIIKSKVN